jgi:hypothetical protein
MTTKKDLQLMVEANDNKIERYESLIRTQGAYLIELSRLVRTGRKRKEIITFLNKYGIGLEN